jgi:hypothetical protein
MSDFAEGMGGLRPMRSRAIHSAQGRIRHNALRAAFGTYSVSSLISATHSRRSAYNFSFRKVSFLTSSFSTRSEKEALHDLRRLKPRFLFGILPLAKVHFTLCKHTICGRAQKQPISVWEKQSPAFQIAAGIFSSR